MSTKTAFIDLLPRVMMQIHVILFIDQWTIRKVGFGNFGRSQKPICVKQTSKVAQCLTTEVVKY
ncbi:haloacid dehalogenase-like hydrolase family protein [Sesbania bispinosa]|nr:haloacid dehalogenase-like hydrolase family protein [Sesbania bispinosa]